MTPAIPALTLSAVLLLAACGHSEQAAPAGSSSSAASTSSVAAASSSAPPATNQAALPEIPTLVVDTFDGGKFDLSRHRGNWVVVNFWATWCTPCLKEIPDLDALDKARDDLDVIGLAYEEIERADMQAFLKEHQISYPIAVVDVYKPPADFAIPKGLPMTYLIAPDGKVARQFLGPVSSQDLVQAMAAHQLLATTPSK